MKTAIAAGYRPCAVCLPEKYAQWKNTQKGMIRMSKIKRYSFSPLIENTENQF